MIRSANSHVPQIEPCLPKLTSIPGLSCQITLKSDFQLNAWHPSHRAAPARVPYCLRDDWQPPLVVEGLPDSIGRCCSGSGRCAGPDPKLQPSEPAAAAPGPAAWIAAPRQESSSSSPALPRPLRSGNQRWWDTAAHRWRHARCVDNDARAPPRPISGRMGRTLTSCLTNRERPDWRWGTIAGKEPWPCKEDFEHILGRVGSRCARESPRSVYRGSGGSDWVDRRNRDPWRRVYRRAAPRGYSPPTTRRLETISIFTLQINTSRTTYWPWCSSGSST